MITLGSSDVALTVVHEDSLLDEDSGVSTCGSNLLELGGSQNTEKSCDIGRRISVGSPEDMGCANSCRVAPLSTEYILLPITAGWVGEQLRNCRFRKMVGRGLSDKFEAMTGNPEFLMGLRSTLVSTIRFISIKAEEELLGSPYRE